MNRLREPQGFTQESAPKTKVVEVRPLETHTREEMYCVREANVDGGGTKKVLQTEFEELPTFQPISIGVCAMNKKVSASVPNLQVNYSYCLIS